MRGVIGECGFKANGALSRFEGGKHQVGLEAKVGSKAEVGISIK